MPTGIRRFSAKKLFAILAEKQLCDRDLCRLVRALNAADHGRAIQVFPQELSKWRAGAHERNPAEDKLWAICRVLQCKWEEISEPIDLDSR